MKAAFYILAIFLCISCITNTENNNTVMIDLDKIRDTVSVREFSENITITLTPLETTESSYFDGSASKMIVNNYIFILDRLQNSILRFDKDGKFLNKINRTGNGPEEYVRPLGIAVWEESVFILDHNKIQQYNLNGEYISTIPLAQRGYQIQVLSNGNLAVTGSYADKYQLTIYDPTGRIIHQYLPSRSELSDMPIKRAAMHSLGSYNNEPYFTNYFDYSIYRIKPDTVQRLIDFDFGKHNIPDDMFEGAPAQKKAGFSQQRESSVMSIDNVTVTDKWIIFVPELLKNNMVVYYNRKNHTYLLNKWFIPPYSILLGGYNAPHGYDQQNGLYFTLISSKKLKDILAGLSENDQLNNYTFLAKIDSQKIDETDNDWILWFSI